MVMKDIFLIQIAQGNTTLWLWLCHPSGNPHDQ